jgi:hypothetical protein
MLSEKELELVGKMDSESVLRGNKLGWVIDSPEPGSSYPAYIIYAIQDAFLQGHSVALSQLREEIKEMDFEVFSEEDWNKKWVEKDKVLKAIDSRRTA